MHKEKTIIAFTEIIWEAAQNDFNKAFNISMIILKVLITKKMFRWTDYIRTIQ